MKVAIWVAVKRFIRVLIAGAVGGAAAAALSELQAGPYWFVIGPAVTAAVAALGKFIREKWGLEVPF